MNKTVILFVTTFTVDPGFFESHLQPSPPISEEEFQLIARRVTNDTTAPITNTSANNFFILFYNIYKY
jgi:hypothetical protein